jgi:predicted dinucleotide-binding enzyme
MNIGIIGAGAIGGTLAAKLVKLGHTVSIANSRGPDSLKEVAARTGATPVTAKQAARAGEVVILSIPQINVPGLPADLFEGVAGNVVVIDTNNYYPKLRDGDIAPKDGIDSQWVADRIGRSVVKVFNNIYANSLATKGAASGTPARLALPVAGDDPRAKQIVLELVDALGFDPIDAGALAESWRQQPGTPCYCHDFDRPAMAQALAAADRRNTAQYRDEADEAARKFRASLEA